MAKAMDFTATNQPNWPINEVVVSGGRQSGRTHVLIHAAIEDARRGERVLYSNHQRRESEECFIRAERQVRESCPGEIDRIYRGNGEQRIQFVSGGELRFFARSGDAPTVHVLDNVPDGSPPLISSRLKRVYRSALS